MGVIDGQAVSAAITNAAFLQKNAADTMPFNLAISAALNFPKNVVSTSGAINALDSTKVNVKLTGSSVTLNGVTAGSNGQVMIIQNSTGSSITVNSLSGSASSANQFQLPTSTASIPANSSAFFQYDSTAQKWYQIGSSNGSGSGGSKNYFSLSNANPTFEGGVSSPWSACTLTWSGNAPSGAPTLTATQMAISTTTTNPLIGSYSGLLTKSGANAQYQGFISGPMVIDREDTAKVLYGSFSYEVVSGSPVFSGNSTQSLSIWVYNTVSGQWIQPAGYKGMNQTSGAGKVTFSFQTDGVFANNTYQVAIITEQAETIAYSISFDDFVLGPTAILTGAAVTDWQSFTPTGTWTTNTIYAGKWRRVGDSMELQYDVTLTGAPNAALLTLNLPSGYSIDSSKWIAPINGSATCGYGGSLRTGISNQTLFLQSNTLTSFVVYAQNTAGAYEADAGVTNTVPVTWGNGDTLFFNAMIPIAGWSSNVQVSSDTDTRVVAAAYCTSSSVSGSPTAPFNFATQIFDTAAAVTIGSSWNYKCSVSGYYQVSTALFLASGSNATCYVYKNGVAQANLGTLNSTTFATGSAILYCSAGDLIDIRPGISSTLYNTVENRVNIQRISGPSVIAATETVAARYYTTAGNVINNSTVTVVFGSKTFDTHNAYNASTGIFTVPVSGKYLFTTYMRTAFATWNTGYAGFAFLNNGSTIISTLGTMRYSSTISGINLELGGSSIVSCNAGDQLKITVYSDTSTTLDTAGAGYYNYFDVVRVGN